MRPGFLASVCLLACLPTAAFAAGFDTGFPVYNEGALARSFALPELGDAQVLAPGRWQQRITLDWSNEYVADSTSSGESLIEDGESQRYGLDVRRGLPDGFEVGLQLPVLIDGGGVLDGPIQSWHQFWGLPDGGRQYAPKNRLLYRYQADGQTLLDVDQSTAGIGDLRLYGGWQARPGLALRVMAKLPTGDADHLMGGNPGGAAWVDYEPMLDPTSGWYSYLSAGGSYNGGSKVLSQLQRRWVGLLGGGIGYHLTRGFALQGQLYFHTPLYAHTDEQALKRSGLQGAFGGRYTFNPHVAFEAGFQEDLITDSSPDFSIHLGLVLR